MKKDFALRKDILYVLVFLSACLVAYIFMGCKNDSLADEKSKPGENGSNTVITFATWNVQTFFDAQTEGTEYDEYKKAGKWSKDKYLTRLGRLCDVMTTLNADVFVFEEIENQAVVQDIANQVVGKNLSRNKKWDYAFFAKEEGSAIGCAVFSRYQIGNIKTHSMDIRSQNAAQPTCRPVIEFTLNVGNKDLTIFANHWKSKLGDDESRIWRQWQESVACINIEKAMENAPVILCGDFNQDAKEFSCDFSGKIIKGLNEKSGSKKTLANQNENVIFKGAKSSGESVQVPIYSPWYSASGKFTSKIGSYFYQGEWERIDHIFAAGDVKVSSFSPRAEEPWADSEKKPISYKLYSGEGYSDHLPIMCTLIF